MPTISPDYRTRYRSTPSSCECPAKAFRPSVPCKHQVLEAQLAAIQERKERDAAIARTNILARYGSTPTRCSCSEFIESRDGGIDAGGSCEHTRWLQARAKTPVYDWGRAETWREVFGA